MKFKEIFGKYKNLTNISQASLARESGLTPSVISRYANGERTPAKDSDALNAISNAFFNRAKSQNIQVDLQTVLSDFKSCDEYKDDNLSTKLDGILTRYEIKTAELARALSMDNSFVSRIRNGIRSPKDTEGFIKNTCKYIADTHPDTNYENLLKEFSEAESFNVNNTKSVKNTTPSVTRSLNTDKKEATKATHDVKSSYVKSTDIKSNASKPIAKKHPVPSRDSGLLDKLSSILNPRRKSKNKRKNHR